MSIEAVFVRIAEALEGIHDTLVSDRLDRQRGGAGTPGHVDSAGMVDNVIARKLDTKAIQTEMEKLDRPDIFRELKLLGQDPSNKLGDKRLRKMLVEAIMNKKAQDDVYGNPLTLVEAIVAQEKEDTQDAGTTENAVSALEGVQGGEKSGESAAETTASAEPEPVVASVHVEEVSREQMKKTCLAFVQAVHGGDVVRGQAALAAILHKFDPSYEQLKDLAPEHRVAFHEEVLNT